MKKVFKINKIIAVLLFSQLIFLLNNKNLYSQYYNERTHTYYNEADSLKIDFSEDYLNILLKNMKYEKFADVDLSQFFLEKNDFPENGVLGKTYKRIMFHFDSVFKTNNDSIYLIYWQDKVNKNIYKIHGKIKILYSFINKYYDCSEYIGETNCYYYHIVFKYQFYEDSSKQHSGLFQGIGDIYLTYFKGE